MELKQAIRAAKAFLFQFSFNTLLALFWTAIYQGSGFSDYFFFCQCVGILVFFLTLPILSFLKFKHLLLRPILVTLAGIGVTLGLTWILSASCGQSILALIDHRYGLYIQTLLLNSMFVVITGFTIISREKMAAAQARMQQERIRRLTSEKRAAETHLKFLQAQIEPHFLFNTLSTILSLLDSDAGKGKAMLIDFIRYLRISLSKARRESSTIEEEISMITAYLSLYKVRMEDRLEFEIHLPENLKKHAMPPMIVQPLVENAIRHGLQDKRDGGRISIRIGRAGDRIRLEVADTGSGFDTERPVGTGLSNVRSRLRSIYGDAARLILEDNSPSGLRATIEVPHE
jgi:LytS/YehU family sensor histidine kinase